MSYWPVVVKVPAELKTKLQMEYVPSLIFFECDGDIKGIAAFSDQDSAQAFRSQLSQIVTFDVLCTPLRTVEDVRAWCDILHQYLGPEKYCSLPIYLDPPDAYCKDVRIPANCKNVWTFIAEHMPENMHPLAGDIVGFQQVGERSVVILQDSKTKQYGALVNAARGSLYKNGIMMLVAFMEDQGTISARSWHKTEPADSIFTAIEEAKTLIATF